MRKGFKYKTIQINQNTNKMIFVHSQQMRFKISPKKQCLRLCFVIVVEEGNQKWFYDIQLILLAFIYIMFCSNFVCTSVYQSIR